MRKAIAGILGPDSTATRWLDRQNWLHSANELLERGHARLNEEKFKQASDLYHRAMARTREFKANIRPHLAKIEKRLIEE